MNFFKHPVFRNTRFIFIIWVSLAVVAGVSKYAQGHGGYGNYLTYKNVAVQLAHQEPIYLSEHVLYGPVFGVLMLPFAFLPDWLGIALWLGTLAMLLFWAIGKLPVEPWQKVAVYWICVHEMMTAAFNMQFNIGIAAMIVLAFVFVEKEKDVWAALVIVLGTLTKIYGIVGLAFFLFSKHKWRFALACAGWALVWLALPLLFVSPEYLFGQYIDWIHQIVAKNAANNTHTGASIMQNISLTGMLQRVFHLNASATLPIIAAGITLFVIPLFRIRQYANRTFRLLFMASVLLFVVLFSTGSESSTYIIAFAGVAVWFVLQPRPYRIGTVLLLIFVLLLSSLSPTDLFPRSIRETWIIPYSLKALPCTIVWLWLAVQLCRNDFSPAITKEKI
ncbi:MAG: DUF2029 domain-containing protein [Prevotellaceae bacterium]|jgi:hypothetical protein|nr:DUF2029 domain-containing protein [Prevotellaceae bacterium]